MSQEVEESLRHILESRLGRWPGEIEHFETVTSTSDRLKERARSGAPEWSAVLADRQTVGRGRHGRTWASPRGNLFLSVLLRPAFSSEGAAAIPLAAGVAAAEALEELGVATRLKWPNDLVVGERKLGGILAEATSGGAGLEAVVLGVGVNLDLGGGELPPPLRESTTSVFAETGRRLAPVAVAAAVLARLSVWYHALARAGPGAALLAWRARSVPWWGRPVEARSGETVIKGTARDIDERGALLLDLDDGSSVALFSGEVRELRLARARPSRDEPPE